MMWATASQLCAALAVLAGAGCGGDDDEPEPVIISTGAPAALVAFRDHRDTTWREIPVNGQTQFEVVPTGPYEVVIVCERKGNRPRVSAFRHARTLEDAPLVEATCASGTEDVLVSGRVQQPGLAGMAGSSRATTSGGWSFDFSVRPGRYDLILASGDLNTGFEQISIRPALEVTANLDLGEIDLTREAMQPLVPTTFTATNLGADEIKDSFLFLLDGTWRTSIGLPGSEWAVKLAPASVLRSSEQQYIQLLAARALQGDSMKSSARGRTIPANVGGPTSVTLPEPLGAVTFERSPMHAVATWSTLPAEYDELRVFRASFGTTLSRLQMALVSRAYVKATGAVDVRLDFRDVPGFREEWHFLTDPDQFCVLAAEKGSLRQGDEQFSEASEAFMDGTPTSSAAIPPAERLTQLRRSVRLAREAME